MLDPLVMRFFSEELEKISSNVALGAGLLAGGYGAIKGQELLRDAQEGKQLRRSRELQRLQQLNALENPVMP
jgi:hypothetical protein